jgi:cell pole-organizing protein PopZ
MLLFPDQQNEEAAPVTHDNQDELNLDHIDLDESTHKEEKPHEEPAQAASTPVASGHDLNDEEFLKKLEQEAAEKMNQPQKNISHAEEIDREFEKEIMGFKPKQPDEAPQDKPAQAPETLPQTVEDFLEKGADEKSQTGQPNAQAALDQLKKDGLINESTAAQASDSIKRLIDAQNVVGGITQFSQSSAFAELATQIMEPKLEKWLNENLPQMVEKIVREEIRKLIPKE